MQYFVTATGTDIGKTFFIERICQKLIDEGNRIEVIKPIISGFKDGDETSDSARILKVLNLDLNQENFDKISPYRFLAPLSPNIAAALENKEINFAELVKFCQEKIDLAKADNYNLLIEGAGGVMTPINNEKTFADLIAELKIPAILITANYLGTISHTLTAISALQSQRIEIAKIIFNCKEDNVDAASNLETLKKFTNIPIDEIR